MSSPRHPDEKLNPDPPAERAIELAGGALEAERKSAENLGARSVALVGFTGVILALTAGLGRDAVAKNVDLGKVGEPLAAALSIAAIAALVVAVVVGVGVVTPRPRGRLPIKLLEDLRDGRIPVEHAEREAARLTIKQFKEESLDNDGRGIALRRALRVLLLGLALVAAQAVIIGIDRLEVT